MRELDVFVSHHPFFSGAFGIAAMLIALGVCLLLYGIGEGFAALGHRRKDR